MQPRRQRKNAGATPTGGPRRWLRPGPGLVLAIIASLFIWRFYSERSSGLPERAAVAPGSQPVEPSRPAPDLGFVLAMKGQLQLNARQVAALTRIHRQWQGQTAAVQQATERAAAEFNRGMEARQGKGDTLPSFQENASEVSVLSHQLVAARRAAWGEAAGQLTPFQRGQAEALWHERLHGRGGPVPTGAGGRHVPGKWR